MKKQLSTILAVVALCSTGLTAVGCGGGGGVKIDKTKTQLYYSNYDAGIGRTWIEAIASEFEKDFANYSFEPGKTGVQVIPNHNRIDTGAQLLSGINSSEDYVFFTEGVDYPAFSNGKAYDVTAVMNAGAITGVDAEGNFLREEVTIESKISPEFLSYLNRGTAETEKYCGFPYYLALKSVLYDKDLWNEKRYYFAKEIGCPSEIVADALFKDGDIAAATQSYYTELAKLKDADKNNDDYWWFVNEQGVDVDGEEMGLSAGPDGKYGTYDDGMAATYEEFYLLMDKLVADNIVPFTWTGKNPGYADMMTTALWQNYEGSENLKVYYSLNGEVGDLVKLSSGKVVYKEDGITPETESYTFNGGRTDGYEIQRSLGKYYALQFADKIATNNAWTANDCYAGVSHITAQSNFITSVLGKNGNRRAMLVDGAWWQQESDQTFLIMAKENEKYSKFNRNIAMMMLPNATIERCIEREQNDIKNTMVAANDSFVLVNGNLKEGSPELAVTLAFVSYMNSDKCLNLFSEKTNMYRGLNYKITDETKAKMTSYGKSFVDYVEETDVVYPYSNNELFLNNYQYLSNTSMNWNWHSWVGDVEPYFPITQLHDSGNRKAGLNGKSYFEGLYNYYKNRVWSKLI